jgi:negative regulator of sigma E activity
MNEERQNERDSQLSAMFDGELSAAECELLARRLTRDEALRGQWSRYALIGAAVRAERGVKLDDRVARRVQSAISQEPTYGDSSSTDAGNTVSRPAAAAKSPGEMPAGNRWLRFARPVFGAGIAAGVAALSILWVRGQPGDETQTLAAVEAPSQRIVLSPETQAPTVASLQSPLGAAGISADYSTPPNSSATSMAPPARLANYVVAHSEYSGPLSRRLALSGLVAGEPASDTVAADSAAPAPNPETDEQKTQKRIATDAP